VKKENRLKKVLNEFSREGVTVIPLKGAAFQNLLYENIGLRSMTDIDILVHPKDFLPAANILCHYGFAVSSEDSSKGITWLAKTPKEYWPEVLSFSDQQGLVIELHHHLVNTWFQPVFLLNMDDIWERSISL
jgi:hypothetical protein